EAGEDDRVAVATVRFTIWSSATFVDQHAEDFGERGACPVENRRSVILERLRRGQLAKGEVHEGLEIAGHPQRRVGWRRTRTGDQPALSQLQMEHLVADYELERVAATRVQQLGLRGGEAQGDEVGAGGPRVDAVVEGEVEPPQPEGEQRVTQTLSVLGELVDRDGGRRR